jgi:hypothetical protein
MRRQQELARVAGGRQRRWARTAAGIAMVLSSNRTAAMLAERVKSFKRVIPR